MYQGTFVPTYPPRYLSAGSGDDAVLPVIDGLWGKKCPSISRASELNKHTPRREPLWLSELDLLDESQDISTTKFRTSNSH